MKGMLVFARYYMIILLQTLYIAQHTDPLHNLKLHMCDTCFHFMLSIGSSLRRSCFSFRNGRSALCTPTPDAYVICQGSIGLNRLLTLATASSNTITSAYSLFTIALLHTMAGARADRSKKPYSVRSIESPVLVTLTPLA